MGYVRKTKRTFRKAFKTVRRAAIKRYFKKGYSPKIGTMLKDVALLKQIVNSEKKCLTYASNIQPVGQVNGATSPGFFIEDMTPDPAQGLQANQRIGNSIKWVSTDFHFQISAQGNNIDKQKIKFVFVRVVGRAEAAAPTANIWDANPFITGSSLGVVDYNSSRNQDFFKDYKIIRTKTYYHTADNISGEKGIINGRIGLKFKTNNHVRFDTNTTTIASQGQIWMYVFVDNGNISPTTPCTLAGISNPAINTGITLNYYYSNYFYDN